MSTYTIRFVPAIRPDDFTGKLVSNPYYSDRKQPDTGWCIASWHPDPHYRQKNQAFYDALEASVLAEGFRNPVCGYSFEDGVYIKTGASRLWVAYRNGLTVGALISDHCGRFADCVEVIDPNDYLTCEAQFYFDERGFHYTHLADRAELPPA